MRTFVIPMVGPAAGKGTSENPWRPKYVHEAGLSYSSQGNFRYAMLCVVKGTDTELDALAAHADVVEVTPGGVHPSARGRLTALLARRGIVPPGLGGPHVFKELREAIANKQRSETAADRAAILIDLQR